MTNFNDAPSYASVMEAAKNIENIAVRTPLLESSALNEKIGARLFLKCEMLQNTGSFKFRGAYNALSKLTPEQRTAGVFAYSSGNHAQGVALAAKMLGSNATILMPEDTPDIKVASTKGYGATVVQYDRYSESREEIGTKIALEKNLTLIKPYDNVDVISGQGTVGLEIIEQLSEKDVIPQAIVAPCGGGGLMSGIGLAVSKLSPNTRLYSAEPENFDDTSRSLAAKTRVANTGDHRSLCDAIVTPMPGEITFPILSELLSEGLVVSEKEVTDAVRIAFEYFKVVIEPGGAVALAALLSGKIDGRGQNLVAVGSGGNVDPALFAKILQNEV